MRAGIPCVLFVVELSKSFEVESARHCLQNSGRGRILVHTNTRNVFEVRYGPEQHRTNTVVELLMLHNALTCGRV